MSVPQRSELENSPLADLHALASEVGLEGYRRLRREALIDAILAGREDSEEQVANSQPDEAVTTASQPGQARQATEQATAAEDLRRGILDILPNGCGFIRAEPFVHSSTDVYISPAQIRRCELRAGDELEGPVRPPRRSERYPSLVRVEAVNGAAAEPPASRPHFDELTPRFATERLPTIAGLESTPFGKGSRVAIGGAPGAGATTILRRITGALADETGVETVVVLCGVRPEEVPEWKDAVTVTVAGGGCDRSVDEQAQVADLAIERGKRAVEQGRDAAVVVDTLEALPAGVGRRVFGAARNTTEAGSLTVVAVVDPYSELQRLATTRVVLDVTASQAPAIDHDLSHTMRTELLS